MGAFASLTLTRSHNSILFFRFVQRSAVVGGANRLEVCANLTIGGGTTPSVGLVLAIAKAVPNVPLMVRELPHTRSDPTSADY